MQNGQLGVSVGSNVFNVLGVLCVAVIRSLSVGSVALDSVAWLIFVTAVMVAALWTG